MKKVVIGSSALAIVVCLSGVIWWYFFLHDTHRNAVSIAKNNPQSIELSPIANIVASLRTRIDIDTGYQQMGLLSSGDSDAWNSSLYDQELIQGPMVLENAIAKCSAPDDVKQKLKDDAINLKRLYEVADQEWKAKDYKDGAQALKYFHRVTEDINYYIHGSGEEYGVTHIQGGYQRVESFINAHMKNN